MMLRDEHDTLRARRDDRVHPLVGIELRRVEDLRVRRAVGPRAVQKCVRADVQDHARLQVLPHRLLRRRLQIRRALRERRKARKQPRCRQGSQTPSAMPAIDWASSASNGITMSLYYDDLSFYQRWISAALFLADTSFTRIHSRREWPPRLPGLTLSRPRARSPHRAAHRLRHAGHLVRAGQLLSHQRDDAVTHQRHVLHD